MASIETQLDGVLMVRPINAVKDPVLFSRIKKAFEEQIKEIKRNASEHTRHGEDEIVVPSIPMADTKAVENDKVDGTSTKAQQKRGRKTTSKFLFRVPFSFETPKFCAEENIDLQKVLLKVNQYLDAASGGNHAPTFSVTQRLQHWFLEKRERCKNGKANKVIIQDCYFHHVPSNLSLRSLPEVFDFVLHGNLPLKGGRKKAKLDETVVLDNQLHKQPQHEAN